MISTMIGRKCLFYSREITECTVYDPFDHRGYMNTCRLLWRLIKQSGFGLIAYVKNCIRVFKIQRGREFQQLFYSELAQRRSDRAITCNLFLISIRLCR